MPYHSPSSPWQFESKIPTKAQACIRVQLTRFRANFDSSGHHSGPIPSPIPSDSQIPVFPIPEQFWVPPLDNAECHTNVIYTIFKYISFKLTLKWQFHSLVHSCIKLCTIKNVSFCNINESFHVCGLGWNRFRVQVQLRPILGQFQSGTSHSGPIPSLIKYGLESRIESGLGLYSPAKAVLKSSSHLTLNTGIFSLAEYWRHRARSSCLYGFASYKLFTLPWGE